MKCGLCFEGKPCNAYDCPEDTVHASDYNKMLNAKNARIQELESENERMSKALLRISENDAAYGKPFAIARDCLASLKPKEGG